MRDPQTVAWYADLAGSGEKIEVSRALWRARKWGGMGVLVLAGLEQAHAARLADRDWHPLWRSVAIPETGWGGSGGEYWRGRGRGVAWRSELWLMEDSGELHYRRRWRWRRVPWVLLRDRSGALVVVVGRTEQESGAGDEAIARWASRGGWIRGSTVADAGSAEVVGSSRRMEEGTGTDGPDEGGRDVPSGVASVPRSWRWRGSGDPA